MPRIRSARRLGWSCAALGVLALLACAPPAPATSPATTAPEIASGASAPVAPLACRSAAPTPAQTEGPYFKPGAPQRESLLEPGMAGARLVVQGQVLGRNCRPLAGVRLDFWQADDQGVYDNAGYRLRGHQLTGADGQYRLETIVPAEYPGRPPHIHVKVTIPNGPSLTTQLYFPGGTSRDSLYDPRLVLPLEETPQGRIARFNFVP